MSVHDITPAAQIILSETSHQFARSFGATELRPSHILYAILTQHEKAAAACRLLGVEYHDLKTVTEDQLRNPNPGIADGEPLLASPRGSRLLEDAMWFAECRHSASCGVGDLFIAALISVRPELLGKSPYDCGTATEELLCQVAECFAISQQDRADLSE